MFGMRSFIMLILLGCILIGCGIETAKPFKKQHLFIVSDCLDHTDSVLFRSFEKNYSVDLHIKNLSSDSIFHLLKKEGYSTEFDAVILRSVYDMNSLNTLNVLHRLHDDQFPENLPIKHRSSARTFCGIGIDPYVILTKDDSLSRVRNYKDLTIRTPWCTDLDGKSDWYPFYAPIVNKIKPEEKYNAVDWISNFKKNEKIQLTEQDSSLVCKTVFTTYSHYRNNKLFRSSGFKEHTVIFPNQRSGGTYFNMPCFAIVKQARNFSNAVTYLQYLFLETVNKRINYHWSMFPLINETVGSIPYQNIRFKKYSVSPIRLTANYDRLINILRIID